MLFQIKVNCDLFHYYYKAANSTKRKYTSKKRNNTHTIARHIILAVLLSLSLINYQWFKTVTERGANNCCHCSQFQFNVLHRNTKSIKTKQTTKFSRHFEGNCTQIYFTPWSFPEHPLRLLIKPRTKTPNLAIFYVSTMTYSGPLAS